MPWWEAFENIIIQLFLVFTGIDFKQNADRELNVCRPSVFHTLGIKKIIFGKLEDVANFEHIVSVFLLTCCLTNAESVAKTCSDVNPNLKILSRY